MKSLYLIPGIIFFQLSGCSDSDPGSEQTQQQQDHVWKEQTEAIEKAKAVEGLLMDSAEDQRRQIQDQTE